MAKSITAGIEFHHNNTTINNSPASVNATAKVEWSCTETNRILNANGIPDHSAGVFPNKNSPNAIQVQTSDELFTLNPKMTDTAEYFFSLSLTASYLPAPDTLSSQAA